MSASWERLPVIVCAGQTAAEVGFSHGEQLRDRIAETLEYYFQVFQALDLELDSIRSWGIGYRLEIEAVDKDLVAEIDGIARGACRANWELYALNARSEILARAYALGHKTSVAECTSIYCVKSSFLAQNWDWDTKIERLPVLLQIPRHGSKPAMLSMTEPGMLAKIGLNDCGVGVCLNFMSGPKPLSKPSGIPVHCLLRLALTCEDLPSAQSLLKQTPHQCACHILLADSSMQYRLLEFAGSSLEIVMQDANARNFGMEDPIEGAEWQDVPPTAVFHTNHYLQRNFEARYPADVGHSRERYQRVQSLVDEYDAALEAELGRRDVWRGGKRNARRDEREGEFDLLRSILGDCSRAPKSILMKGGPSLIPGGNPTGTICSIIMDLRSKCMHITRGDVADQNYEKVFLISAKL